MRRSRGGTAGLAALLLLAVACGAAPASRAGTYDLGQGVDLGPFNVSGYANLVGGLPAHASSSVVLDDLSIFVTGHLGRFVNPFTEVELSGIGSDALAQREGTGRGDEYLVLERLYNDSYLTDAFTLRVGKMLTPVGAWNVIHAAPLVLTTVRPAVTYRDFSEYVAGFSLLYRDPEGQLPDTQIYWQPGKELAARPNPLQPHRYRGVAGAHVSFPVSLLDRIGFSVQHEKILDGREQTLVGSDLQYSLGRVSVQAEGTYSTFSGAAPGLYPAERRNQFGGYLSTTYSLDDKWSVYTWYEGFAFRAGSSPAQDALAGISFKPRPALVLKFEYLENFGGAPVNPRGLFTSISMLF